MLTACPHFFPKKERAFGFSHATLLFWSVWWVEAQIWRWWECVGPQWVKQGISCCGCTDNEGRKHPGGGRGELRWELRHYRLVLPVYKSLWRAISKSAFEAKSWNQYRLSVMFYSFKLFPHLSSSINSWCIIRSVCKADGTGQQEMHKYGAWIFQTPGVGITLL